MKGEEGRNHHSISHHIWNSSPHDPTSSSVYECSLSTGLPWSAFSSPDQGDSPWGNFQHQLGTTCDEEAFLASSYLIADIATFWSACKVIIMISVICPKICQS